MKNINAIVIIGLLFTGACTNNKKESKAEPNVSEDKYYTNLFDRQGEGFTGGDGTYSVELPDGSTAWIFGDTFIGGVNPDNTRKKQVPIYVRNTLVIQDGDSLRTLYSMKDGLRASFVIPPPEEPAMETLPEDSVWFWPGDAFIENGDLYLFLSEFIQADTGMWGFQWEGTWLAIYDLPEIKQKELHYLPQGEASGIHLGHAVFKDDEYTYVYGAKGGIPHAARYPSGNYMESWEYYAGEGWSTEPGDAKAMGDISGSEQFSVFKIEDSYVLLTQMGGLSDEICSFTSSTPYGPWGNQTLLYKTPIADTTDELFTYNAVAHPHLIDNGELLVSYNMNSRVLEDHFRNADIYRPRFIRVPIGIIDSSFLN